MPDERNSGRLVVMGANHRTSSEATRDRLFVPEDGHEALLREIVDAGAREAAVLSTCARTEIHAIVADADAATAAFRDGVVGLLARFGGLDRATVADQTYCLEAGDAVRHLFRIAASLDSPIVGEPEVTGQFKDSFRLAGAAGTLGSALEAIAQAANGVAKRVRTETAIGERPVSMAACALQAARDVHGELSRRSALLIVGGEMGELVADHVRGAGLTQLTVAARTPARAEIAARRYACHNAALDDLDELLPRADIVISSQGAGRFLFEPAAVEAALAARRRRPVLFLDVAIPSDVDPAVNDLDGAFVYGLDDLDRLALEGRSRRDEAAVAAEAIVEAETARFLERSASRAATPAVVALRAHFERLRRDVLKDMAVADPVTDDVTRRLINRLLHAPSAALRDHAADDGDTGRLEETLRRLFDIDGDAAPPPPGEEKT